MDNGAAVTCSDGLPAYREGGPGLHHVHGNRAVVVRPRAPGKLHSSVSSVSHQQALWGTRRSCDTRRTRTQTHTCISLSAQQQPKQMKSAQVGVASSDPNTDVK